MSSLENLGAKVCWDKKKVIRAGTRGSRLGIVWINVSSMGHLTEQTKQADGRIISAHLA